MSMIIDGSNGLTFPNSTTQATASSMVLIASATASSSATIDFTSISNTSYNAYRIYVTNILPSTSSTNLLLRMSNAGTFATSGYYQQSFRWTTSASGITGQSATATGIPLNSSGDLMVNTALSSAGGGSFVVDISECSNTTAYKRVNIQGYYLGSTQLGITANGMSPNTSAVDGFRLLMDAGTITSGTFFLYGIKNA